MKKNIPFFNYPAVFAEHEHEYRKIIEDVLGRGAFILQKEVKAFEENLARFLNVKHAIGVGNCTDALFILLKLAGLKPSDEVILPAHTFIATAAAVHWAGGVPVPVDCSPDHMIDPKSAERAITPRTRFLMPVQINGRTCNMEALIKIAKDHGLILLEDAAQALGARYQGKLAGTFGLAAAFSFYPAKALNAFGDAGALVTNDDQLAEQAHLFRDHGRDEQGEVLAWGVNSRLDNLQAAILNFKLEHYKESIDRRRALASLYQEYLKDIPELLLPPGPNSDPDRFDIFQNYEIEAERRDELRIYLKEYGVGTLVQWSGKPVHHHKKLGWEVVSLPQTDKLFERCLLLPMNTYLSDSDIEYICDQIRAFYGRR